MKLQKQTRRLFYKILEIFSPEMKGEGVFKEITDSDKSIVIQYVDESNLNTRTVLSLSFDTHLFTLYKTIEGNKVFFLTSNNFPELVLLIENEILKPYVKVTPEWRDFYTNRLRKMANRLALGYSI